REASARLPRRRPGARDEPVGPGPEGGKHYCLDQEAPRAPRGARKGQAAAPGSAPISDGESFTDPHELREVDSLLQVASPPSECGGSEALPYERAPARFEDRLVSETDRRVPREMAVSVVMLDDKRLVDAREAMRGSGQLEPQIVVLAAVDVL